MASPLSQVDATRAAVSPECPACGSPHASTEHLRWNHEVRGETPMQHLDRAYTELLQELRELDIETSDVHKVNIA